MSKPVNKPVSRFFQNIRSEWRGDQSHLHYQNDFPRSCVFLVLFRRKDKFCTLSVRISISARNWWRARNFTSLRPSDFVVRGSSPSGSPRPLSATASTSSRPHVASETRIVQASPRAVIQSNPGGNAYLNELVTSSLMIRPAVVARAEIEGHSTDIDNCPDLRTLSVRAGDLAR